MIRRVIVESPWAGDVERHARYLRACLRATPLDVAIASALPMGPPVRGGR